MKYHYQFVSRTTVRIELIAEDRKDFALIELLSKSGETDEHLLSLFRKGLEAYSSGTSLTAARFMNFPTVALCNFVSSEQVVKIPA